MGLHDFPVGACGIVSEMLGRHLLSLGFQEVEYVNAERGPKLDGNWTTHAWLDVAGYTVDITADQFPDWTGEKVAVTLATDWHNGF
ncbi:MULTISPECIES: hypothetical protein [Pirellulaceae]|uniref:hypothetical protein n=1 Tax=Pirellulaceae TaxID=2691357 RepID=UPI001304BEAF|nr:MULTISPECIES: hypothetical protein [Pirellulaceae]